MKRLFQVLLVFLIWTPGSVMAQNELSYLIIHQKDGTQASFGFSEKPVITYTDNDMIIKTDNAPEVRYVMSSLSKISFSDTPTSVSSAQEDLQAPVFEFDGYTVNIQGLKADATVAVFTADGKAVISTKAGKDGSASVSVADQPDGIYVIRTDVISFKILK